MRLASLRHHPDSFRLVLVEEAPAPDASRVDLPEQRDGTAGVLFADGGGTIVGRSFVGVNDDDVLAMDGTGVDPVHRCREPGSRLVKEAVDRWRARGAGRAPLAVTLGILAAERLYIAAGFEPAGESRPLRLGSTRLVAWLDHDLRSG